MACQVIAVSRDILVPAEFQATLESQATRGSAGGRDTRVYPATQAVGRVATREQVAIVESLAIQAPVGSPVIAAAVYRDTRVQAGRLATQESPATQARVGFPVIAEVACQVTAESLDTQAHQEFPATAEVAYQDTLERAESQATPATAGSRAIVAILGSQVTRDQVSQATQASPDTRARAGSQVIVVPAEFLDTQEHQASQATAESQAIVAEEAAR